MANDKTVGTVKPKKEPAKPAAPAQTPGSGPIQKMKKYLEEVRTELRKTTWPTKPELIAQTQVVLGVLVIIGVFIFLWDSALGFIFRGVLNLIGAPQR